MARRAAATAVHGLPDEVHMEPATKTAWGWFAATGGRTWSCISCTGAALSSHRA